ncbi:MAG: prepilin-type N-terminal cleavage/methylation domain-containing protein [Lentisphaerae bacterium]|nr:prepilin-type N-terminal cleavage/methylation domain-containing protein [Lentisphaerota bacterium]
MTRNADSVAPRNRGRRGFTLMELLLVVVISLLAMSMAIPLFGQASRSNKLRVSARTIVAAHRYARGMAVLRQADMVLLLDQSDGRVQVVRLQREGDEADATNEVEEATSEARFLLGSREEETVAAPTNSVDAELHRTLPEGVLIAEIDVDPMQRHETAAWVDYMPNGMCDPFEVTVADDKGRRIVVRVNGATGKAEVLDE